MTQKIIEHKRKGDDGAWYTVVPHLADRATKDATGREISSTYATNASLSAINTSVTTEATNRSNADSALDRRLAVCESYLSTIQPSQSYTQTKFGEVDVGTTIRPIYLKAGVPTQGNEVVDIDSSQNITGLKKHNTSIYMVSPTNAVADVPSAWSWYNGIEYRDKNNVRIGDLRRIAYPSGKTVVHSLDFCMIDSKGTEHVVGIRSNQTDHWISGLTPTTAGINDGAVLTAEYLNNPEKATYLVHRAGTETIPGDKHFQGLLTKQAQWNYIDLKGKSTEDSSKTPTETSHKSIRFIDGKDNWMGEMGYVLTKNTNTRQWQAIINKVGGGQISLGLISDTNLHYAFAPTPTESAPSNAIITKANVMSTDGKLNNLVHTIGNESISGVKTYNTLTKFSQGGAYPLAIAIQHNDLEYDVTPTTERGQGIAFTDKNNEYICWIRFDMSPNGRRALKVFIKDANGTYHETVLASYQG